MFRTFQISEGDGDDDDHGETKPEDTTNRDVLQTLPTFMQRQILAFLRYKDNTLTGRTSSHLHTLWKNNKQLPLFVPEDCATLQEAVGRVHVDDRLTTIVVGKGEHQIHGNYLYIPSAMNIVGNPEVPKEEIAVVGGVYFNDWIQGNCHCNTSHCVKRSGMEWLDSPLLRWTMSLWNSVVVMVWLRLVLASSADVPTWKCGNVI
tara:strand:- start:168 stop:779 length:612 start_codon:yes stop_codon:yes gene_type:complete